MKKVLIIAHYCGDLDGRYSNRFVYLAKLLSQNFEVELLTSDFYHTKKEHKLVTGSYPFKITLIHEPGYKKNVSIKRVISHWVFGKNLRKNLKNKNNFSIVYASFPSFSVAQQSMNFAREIGAKFVIDIQDLWPESFQKILGKNILFNIVYRFLLNKVKTIYKNSNAIVSVSKSFLEIPNKVVSKEIPKIAVYIGTFKFPILSYDKRYPDNKTNRVRLLYLGSLAESYDLMTAINAYEISKVKLFPKISLEFDIIGDGDKKDYFEKYVKKINSTVRFLGLFNYNEIQKIIPNYDIAINPISSWSVANIINKHGDYAMASLPVLNTQKSIEYRELLSNYECGLSSEPGNSEDLASNIITLCVNPNTLVKMRENALSFGLEKFDREQTYKQILDLLLSI